VPATRSNPLRWFTKRGCDVRERRGAEFIQRGAITLDSGTRPTGFTYNPARQLLAWTERTSSTSVYLTSLAAPGRRTELRSDVPGLVPFRFSEDGNYLAAWTKEWEKRKGSKGHILQFNN
jgi:YD repeat-containing protein